MPVTRAQMLKELLPGLEKMFGMAYKPRYEVVCVSTSKADVRKRGKRYDLVRNDLGDRTYIGRDLTEAEANALLKLLGG